MEGALAAELPRAIEPAAGASKTWRPLRFLNAYRLVLATLFFTVSQYDFSPTPLGKAAPELFLYTSLTYLALGIVFLIAAEQRLGSFRAQLYTQVPVDIIAVTLLMHASGGVSSGLGMLLVVSVANAAVITAGRTAGFFAALATIAVLLEQAYVHLTSSGIATSYPQSGMLGITLFATATLAHVMARQARESKALAAQREIDLANLSELTEYVIDQMPTGVLVVDASRRMRFVNAAAAKLLETGAPQAHSLTPALDAISPQLSARLEDWLAEGTEERAPLQGARGRRYFTRFAGIGPDGGSGTIIFVDDAAASSRQVQQLKLAALGRLTASIAHEIRNPMGAITHAAELLGESPTVSPAERRLGDIIIKQGRRVNTIIENVQQLSRRDRSHPERLQLRPWLERYVEQFRQTHKDEAAAEFTFDIRPSDLAVCFDPTHLEQILENLNVNSLRYGHDADGRVRVTLSSGVEPGGAAYLDIADDGPGIADNLQSQVFEPFFTTGANGTGLGLYLARELAECNHAHLDYIGDRAGCRFRLVFPHGQMDGRS